MTPIDYLSVSQGVDQNLSEWLKGYFDGNIHVVTAGAFPQCELGFGVSHLSQPLSGTGAITTISEFEMESLRLGGLDDGARIICEDLRLRFVIRAKIGSTVQGNSAYQCRKIETLLHGVLCDLNALLPLAQNGIYDLQVYDRGSIPLPDYATRQIKARARLEYNIT